MNGAHSSPMKSESTIKEPNNKQEEPEGFITKPTVARRMSKCTRTIDNLMREGLPFYKVGRSTIFKWTEIEAFLAANCRVSRRGN